MNTIKIDDENFQTVILRLFNEHLAITDDVVERSAQLVLKIGGRLFFRAILYLIIAKRRDRRRPLAAHGDACFCKSVLILPSSREISTGLVSKSSQPTAIHFSRSPLMAWAVSAITGIDFVSGAIFNTRVASHPSSTGRLISIKIRAGDSDLARAIPWAPSKAITTSKPRRCKRRVSMSRFISLSSTNNNFDKVCLRLRR